MSLCELCETHTSFIFLHLNVYYHQHEPLEDTMTDTPTSPTLTSLPPEMIHHILFSFDTSHHDVLSTALTCHALYGTIFGPLGEENAFDVDQHRAKSGLVTCITHKWVRATQMALSRGYGDPSANANQSVKLALESFQPEIASLLLADPRVDPSDDANYAIAVAAECGFTSLVESLLDDPRVDPGVSGNHAVRYASELGHLEVVKLLLEDPRVDPGDDDNYAIRWAAGEGRAEVVELLLQDPRVDPGAEDNQALVWSVGAGLRSVVVLLLADPRVSITPQAIQKAAENNHSDILALLLNPPTQQLNP